MRLIDANALVEILSHVRDDYVTNGETLAAKAITCSIKCLESEMISPTIDYVPRQQWISVKDDLPACVVSSVLICYEDGIVVMADWSYDILGNWWFYTDGEYDIDEITHWMPLPEPPKEE